MDIASLLFPQAPSYATGLLGEEEAARLQGQARQAGLLNLGLGLLAAGGPAAVRPGLGQGLIQGLSAGQQAYQNVYSQRLQEMELARKIAEQRRQEQMRSMAGSIIQPTVTPGTPAQFAEESDGNIQIGQMPTAARTGFQIDPQRLAALAALSPDPLAALKSVSEIVPGLRRAGLAGGGMARENPFAFFEQSESSAIKAAANQFAKAYREGGMDDDTAQKRIESLMKMEETIAGRSSSDIRNYQFYVAEQQKLGKTPVPFEQYAAEQAKLKAVQVNLPQQVQEAMFKEIYVKRANDFVEASKAARDFANVSNSINTLLAGMGGGGPVKLAADLQQKLGISTPESDANTVAQALATRAAVNVRAPGSGATSNIEFSAFLQAVPSLSMTEQGRQLMTEFANATARRNSKLADRAMKLAKEQNYSEEAMAAYDESLGPIMSGDLREKINQVVSQRRQSPAVRQSTGGTLDFRTQR